MTSAGAPPHGSRDVATFWHGPPLARLDLACLRSFVDAGFDVTVYGYEPIAGLPEGVRRGDASDIVDRRFLLSFIVKGKPSLSHFSDLFRYRLFQKTGAAWVDMDLFCLRPFVLPASENFFAREDAATLSSSMLRIDRADARLADLVRIAEGFGNGREFAWGSTGPTLLTRTFGASVVRDARDERHFFPVPWDDWWKPFVPSARQECERLCSDASALHLWNNIVERSGLWKDIAPPRESFLHAALTKSGLVDLFRETYPAGVMEQIALNYRNSRTADHMKVAELVRIAAPRAVQAVSRRLGLRRD